MKNLHQPSAAARKGEDAAAQLIARIEACAEHGAAMPYDELFRQVVALGGLHRVEVRAFLQHVQDQLQLSACRTAPLSVPVGLCRRCVDLRNSLQPCDTPPHHY